MMMMMVMMMTMMMVIIIIIIIIIVMKVMNLTLAKEEENCKKGIISYLHIFMGNTF